MPMKLVRRPRAARRLHKIVTDEVRKSYKLLGDVAKKRLELDIKEWSEAPEFIVKVRIGKKVWSMRITWDRGTGIGKIYGWVDEGTGGAKSGTGETYPIDPKNAPVLQFTVPSFPKTVASPISGLSIPGIVLDPGIGLPEFNVFAGHVEHPGITPRRFTESLRVFLNDRERIGAFRSVTEAAIKRAFRKMGIYA